MMPSTCGQAFGLGNWCVLHPAELCSPSPLEKVNGTGDLWKFYPLAEIHFVSHINTTNWCV